MLENSSLKHECYIEQYNTDVDFKDIYGSLSHGAQVEEISYHIYDRLLYHLGKLCIPQTKRACHSGITFFSHFRTFWSNQNNGTSLKVFLLASHYETIAKYIIGCVMCSTSKPSNQKIGLYMPLPIPL